MRNAGQTSVVRGPWSVVGTHRTGADPATQIAGLQSRTGRNREPSGSAASRARVACPALVAVAALALAVGCKSNQTGARAPAAGGAGELAAGMAAIDAGNPEVAIARADQYLAVNRTGSGIAEAHYLRGRAFELRAQRDATRASEHLQAARGAYIEALKHAPGRDLEAAIRAQIGNVAYFQDDYETAVGQLTFAGQHLPAADDRAWALYRSGIAQQRLGRFGLADRAFDDVQARYPNTEPARRAREHRGARTFGVRLATYKDPRSADELVARVRGHGFSVARTTNANGQNVVSIVNLPSYAEARQVKARFAAEHPDAVAFP